MSIGTASGVSIFLGSASSAATQGEFEADSYVEIGEIEDAGQIGDQSAEIQFVTLADGRVRKLKGPRDAGTQTVVCGADPSDEGQAAAIAAEGTTFDYAVKMVLNDQLTMGGTPTIMYYLAKVMSKRRNVGNASNVVRFNFDLGVNSAVIEVAAT